MKFRMKSDGSIKSQGEIRKLYPNKVLPKVWTKTVYEDLQIDPILASPKPTVTELQTAYVSGCKQDSLGNWVESWTIKDRFNDIVDEDGVVIKTAAEQIAEYETDKLEKSREKLIKGIDAHILEVVNSKGYTNTDSIAKYLVTGNPFNEECTTISLWIGDVWVYANNVQAEVEQGNRSMPTIDELVSELPELV